MKMIDAELRDLLVRNGVDWFAIGALESFGVFTKEQFFSLPLKRLRTIPNIGKSRVMRIETALVKVLAYFPPEELTLGELCNERLLKEFMSDKA